MKLGKSGPEVSRIALGCMGMSGMYGPADETESIATIHEAIDSGITLLDTGDFYGMGHNEMLIGRAIEGRRDRVLLSVKFGAMRAPDGNWIGFDGRPQAVKNSLAYSLTRLKTDYIDVYRQSRLDPAVPVEETVGAIAEMVKAGYVRHIGLSEMGAATIRKAAAVHPICDLQIEYSMISRGIEREILPTLRELGIAVTAYGVFSRGLLTSSKPSGQKDIRNRMPRFAAANTDQNTRMVRALEDFAKSKGVTPAQIALAWVLTRGEDILPVVGARTRRQLRESLDAVDVELSPADFERIESILADTPVAGTRYDPGQMRMLDSEKSSS